MHINAHCGSGDTDDPVDEAVAGIPKEAVTPELSINEAAAADFNFSAPPPPSVPALVVPTAPVGPADVATPN